MSRGNRLPGPAGTRQAPAPPARHRPLDRRTPARLDQRGHRDWSPSRIIAWAETIGPQTAALVDAILSSRSHPEQGYRACLGILRVARRDGATRLEAACTRVLALGARSYRHLDAILKHGLDRLPLPEAGPLTRAVVHDQLRGSTYYT